MASLRILPGRSPGEGRRAKVGLGRQGGPGQELATCPWVSTAGPPGVPSLLSLQPQVHPPCTSLMCTTSLIHSFTECVLVPSRAQPWDDARRPESLQL